MKNFNLRIWTLSAMLLVAFTCAYSQQEQGNASGAKVKEKKEAQDTKKEKKLNAVKDQKESSQKEEPKEQTNKPKEKKNASDVKEKPKMPKVKKDTSDVKEKPKKEEGIHGPQKPGEKPEMQEGAKPPKDTVQHEGHAYGKDKGGLEGKEFGQARAAQAKLNKEAKKQELTNSVTSAELKVAEAKEKLQVAKENLEKDKKARKISDAEYQVKKEKIQKVETAVTDLEGKVNAGKEIVAQ